MEVRKAMRLYDENWKEVLDHPLLDAMDQYINDLASLSKEERYQVFKDMMYREPLKYLQEIGSTTYIIRTYFNENGSGKVIDTVNRLMEKKE